jgi:hypothetical protein
MIVLAGPYQVLISKDKVQVNITQNKASVVSTQRIPPVQQ